MVPGEQVVPGHPEVKQEPADPEYEKVGQSQDEISDGSPGSVRNLLREMVESRGKELTVKSVVEHLLQQNEVLLAQNNAQALKPNPRTVKSKAMEGLEKHSSIITPSDPTAVCSKEDLPNINNALVEVAVNEANKSNCDTDLVCAVGSKIMLMTPHGQSLQMDIMYYWCNFCSYKSENKSTLLQHVMEHRFHCKYCKFQSFSRAAVIHHCAEEHENFKETATILRYCTYLPDLLQKNSLKKRQQDGGEEEAPSPKKARVDEHVPLEMEVEEIEPNTSQSEDKIHSEDFSTKNTNSSAETLAVKPGPAKNDMPIITNVTSGHKAVDALLTDAIKLKSTPTGPITDAPRTRVIKPKPAPPKPVTDGPRTQAIKPKPSEPGTEALQTPTLPAPGLTVSSGLCWNCGYCEFVTLSQSFLKIHLNTKHSNRAHKYVAMLVGTLEELERIKASDAKLPAGEAPTVTIMKAPVFLPSSTADAHAPTAQAPKPPGIEIDNAENERPKSPQDDLKIPVSYKCAHCNFSYPKEEQVKVHLFQRHNGCVIYALDMKAVKLKKKRYIFFCLKASCKFKTKETEEWLEHISMCTPWLDGDENRVEVDPGLVKSLELTKTFIEKTASAMGLGQEIKSKELAEYACIYCSYISNNNTRVKKHVMTNHIDKACIIRDVPASKAKKRSSVYFCNQCLWETREGSEVELHLAKRHNITSNKTHEKGANPSAKLDEKPSAADATREPEQEKKTLFIKKGTQAQADVETSESDVEPEEAGNEESTDDDQETEENEYTGVVTEDKFEKALTAYIKSENLNSMKGRGGRSTRNAAIKCRVKVKGLSPPPLYQCLHCLEIHFGTKLMKAHIQEKHQLQPLRAVDILKQAKKNPNFHICFCPSDECTFAEPFAADVVNHSKNKHGINATHSDLVRIMNVYSLSQNSQTITSRGRPSTTATGETYECLYCNESKLYHSRKDMKKHLIDKHKGEEFLFRDCIARKLRQPSRYYMCHNLSCDFTSEKQRDYLMHMLGHQKARIYECSKCQWFTSIRKEIDNHYRSLHEGCKITTLEVDLDLDVYGHAVRSVDGTVIKTEK